MISILASIAVLDLMRHVHALYQPALKSDRTPATRRVRATRCGFIPAAASATTWVPPVLKALWPQGLHTLGEHGDLGRDADEATGVAALLPVSWLTC